MGDHRMIHPCPACVERGRQEAKDAIVKWLEYRYPWVSTVTDAIDRDEWKERQDG